MIVHLNERKLLHYVLESTIFTLISKPYLAVQENIMTIKIVDYLKLNLLQNHAERIQTSRIIWTSAIVVI